MATPTIAWEDGQLRIIDQTRLPGDLTVISLERADAVWEAIRSLRVRGAPAIGVCAAYGVVVGAREQHPDSAKAAVNAARDTADYLATSRPTAVNLFWALDRMRAAAKAAPADRGADGVLVYLERTAAEIHDEDRRLCRAIGRAGAGLIPQNGGVLTHCNAGGLATADYGTALAVMFRAHEEGRVFRVFADETRPLLQGARLTAWELREHDIPVTLICDSMAAQVMKEGKVDLVIVGADRIAANGDTANKIGTYGVALLAAAHKIPFYVAAPTSTVDLNAADGSAIPIEQRGAEEITNGFGAQTAPDGIDVYNPAFDVTPASLIAGIVTEGGILRPPYEGRLREAVLAAEEGRAGAA